jgi:hypothetical protein
MHPAGRQALVELSAASRLLCERWSTLAGRLAGPEAVLLRNGADHTSDLMAEVGRLAEEREIALDESLALPETLREAASSDRFLRRNEALRGAVLDVQYVSTLLAYADAVAASDRDAELGSLCARWQGPMLALENGARGLAIAAADEPDHAIAPADGSPVERAGR